MTTTNTRTVLATESIMDMDWGKFGKALAVGTLLGAVVLAATSQVALSGIADFGGLARAFSVSLTTSMFLTAMVLIVVMVLPGNTYLLRTIVRFDALADGVEVRDAAGALLGSTADGSMRVTNVNLRATNGMHGGLCVVYRGGVMLLSPTPSIGAYPGLEAETTRWFAIKSPLAHALRRHVA